MSWLKKLKARMMNKKFLLSLIILGLIGTFIYVSSKTQTVDKDERASKSQEDKISGFLEVSDSTKSFPENKAEVEKFHNNLKLKITCLANKTCGQQNPNKRFNDDSLQAEVHEVRKNLTAIYNQKLKGKDVSLDNELLLESLKINNTKIMLLALILLQKNNARLSPAIETAQGYRGERAALFVKVVYSRDKSGEYQSELEDLISHYLEQRDNNLTLSLTKKLNELDLERFDLKSYMQKVCTSINEDSEGGKVIRFHLDKLARKQNIKSNCSL